MFVDLTAERVEVQAPKTGRFYVDTDPGDARVKTLNIQPRFYSGIKLDPGRYQLEISASGHEKKTFWIDLEAGEDKQLDVRLEPAASASATGAGDKFGNDLGMEFVFIPPGSFTMGSPENEPKMDSDEKQHQVTLTQGFYLQKTEVTVGQWRAFAGDTGYKSEAETGDGAYYWTGEKWEKDANKNWKNPGFSQGENDPVTCVSWNDAQKFVQWLSKRDGRRYSLPTEAQWEYAARAGTTTPFYFGKCLSTNQANYGGTAPMPDCPKGEYRQKTIPVASLAANKWGLYDMHGNVLEWCQDWYGDYPSGAVTDPVGLRASSTGTGVNKLRSGPERCGFDPPTLAPEQNPVKIAPCNQLCSETS